MSDRLENLLEDAIESTRALTIEIRKLRTGDLVARLSEADREEIAARVHERIDERLAPLEDDDAEGAPRGRGRPGYFRR
jgi:hypothetical protein